MLNVGIHENLVLSKAAKNEKGTLILTFKKMGGVSAMEALASGGSLETPDQQFYIFPPKIEPEDDADTIGAKIAEVRDPLSLIAQQYMTSDKVKFSKMFDGTGVNAENYGTKITDATVVVKIYNNIVNQFLELMSGFVGDDGKKMRMIFVRSSKSKSFPKLRTRYLESQPFIEPMDVPTSKLAFSKYEITNGLNNGTPVASAPAKVNATEAEDAAKHFSS